MLGYIFWGGYLMLALQHPVTLVASSALWISNKYNVSAQSLPGKVTLLPLKLGVFYMSGASLREIRANKDLVAGLVTTPNNLAALAKCKSRKIASALTINEGEISFRGAVPNEIPADCGFDRLRFHSDTPSAATQKMFVAAEQNVSRFGVSLGLATWQSGRRRLVLYSGAERSVIAKHFPAALLPFYDFASESRATPGRNLIFELTLFEFSRERAQNLGIKWPKNLSFLALDPRGHSQLKLHQAGGEGEGEVSLSADFGESQGVGKVLAQPTLRTQPGVESKFLSGGEFPVTNSNAFHSQTSWKSYGLKVALTPNQNAQTGDREVSVDFKVEFSEPNPTQTIGGVPGLLQRQLESRFDVRMDYLTILTTMVTLRESQTRDGLYFLSQLPILSMLFGQQASSRNNSELWFAIRPTWDEIPLDSARDRPVRLESSL